MENIQESRIFSIHRTFPEEKIPFARFCFIAIVYAWNDSAEARGTVPLPRSIDTPDINAPVNDLLAHTSVPYRYYIENNMIALGIHQDEATVSIMGINGRQMCRFTIPYDAHRVKLDQRGLPPGIYLVEIRNENRSVSGVVKWMKTR